jgi:hypothetical protein
MNGSRLLIKIKEVHIKTNFPPSQVPSLVVDVLRAGTLSHVVQHHETMRL